MPTTRPTTPRSRTRNALVAIAALALLATSCELHRARPPGDGPLRYRDEVFREITVARDLAYGAATNQAGVRQTLRLDLYRPVGDTVTRRPAIVWIHGGAFFQGSKTSPEIVRQAEYFAKRGYVTASITYRLNPSPCLGVSAACLRAITDAKHDAQAAVRWLRSRATTYGVDPTRIAAAGTSAGAITALNVGYGPEDTGSSGNPGYDSRVRAAVSLSGGRILTRPNRGEAAALLFHGTADPLVPHSLAVTTVDEAKGAGLAAYLTSWPGDGHVPYVQHATEIHEQTANFLWWHLDLKEAAR